MAEWEDVARALVADRYNALIGYARVLAGPALAAESLVDAALAETIARPRLLRSAEGADVQVRRVIASRVGQNLRKRAAAPAGAHSTPVPAIGDGPVVEDSDAAYRPGAQPRVASTDHRSELSHALEHLTPAQRACVALRHVENLTVGETASVLGLSDDAVRRHVASGIALLNDLLGTDEPTDEGGYVRVVGRDER